MTPRWKEKRLIRSKMLAHCPYCLYCGQRLRQATATLDHIIPVAQGGENAQESLALCCERCNACKGSRSLSQWIADLAKALNSTIPSVRPVDAHPQPTR